MHAVYANCALPAGLAPDLLLTDEQSVAAAAPPGCEVVICDERYDPSHADELNVRMALLASTWTTLGAEDPTLVGGVSAGDLAGREVVHNLLLPAARGVLEARAALADREITRLTTVLDRAAPEQHTLIESVLADAFALAAEHPDAERAWSEDPANAMLVAKYAGPRNARAPEDPPRVRRIGTLLAALANAASTGRRRPFKVIVAEYNPTAAFARWLETAAPDVTAVRLRFAPDEVAGMLRAGHMALAPYAGAPAGLAGGVRERLETYCDAHDAALRDAFAVDGVDLYPLLRPRLIEAVVRHAEWIDRRVRRVDAALERTAPDAVLVPYDQVVETRLLVRLAQRRGIPTVVLNDGWKGDDHQREGMTADRALAISASVAEGYFSRRANVAVTGDPRSDAATTVGAPHTGPLRHVLVGSFTFSPIDLACRRSDAETFLASALDGIARSEQGHTARITLKLHPADDPLVYAAVLERHADLDVTVVSTGDVVAMFDDADLYVTTYSTSLLQAAAAGVPIAYLRVNDQRLYSPFDGEEPVLTGLTARDGAELARVIDDPATRDVEAVRARMAWTERFLGPRDGHCSERVLQALRAAATRG